MQCSTWHDQELLAQSRREGRRQEKTLVTCIVTWEGLYIRTYTYIIELPEEGREGRGEGGDGEGASEVVRSDTGVQK